MTADLEPDAKHVAPSDDLFTARMRFHQSWYRRHVLNLPPGPNPAARGELYGNMLRAEDGLAGWNFVTQGIHRFAEQRLLRDTTHIEAGRLRNNLLSSQPMCFNLFAPLADDLAMATRMTSVLPGLQHIAKVTAVRLEFAPPRETAVSDGTSFDAWIEYERLDGARGFVAVETKLTEPFSQQGYDFGERYASWSTHAEWWWEIGAESSFSNKLFNQLWRNHLLAFAVRYAPRSPYSEATSLVLHHEADAQCSAAVEAYALNLAPLGRPSLMELTLGDLVERWTAAAETRSEFDWLKALRLRYIDLAASEPAWNSLRG